MKSRITKTVALAALMAGAAGGTAAANEGWYGRADVGYSFDGQLDIDSSLLSFGGDGELENDWSQSAGIGYAFANGMRLEGELAHRFNEIDPTTTIDAGGDVHVWSLMLNGYYDFNRGGAIDPYLGIGVGAARVYAMAWDNTAPVGRFNEAADTVAYQIMGGVGLEVTDRLTFDIGYKYFAAPDLEFDGFPLANSPYTADYSNQSVTFGLRWDFGAPPPPPPPPYVAPPPPPPPPPPVAAACPTSEFVVYFEWDRSNLNQAAMDTIDAAVARARQCNVSGAVVVGHTDTSGSAQYNIGLSERRASVVRDALVARGMSAGAIQTQAHGETDLARATRDGVREPLNRRTAVTISFR